MTDQLKEAWLQLKEALEMVPIEQDKSFKIEAVNDGDIQAIGLIKNKDFRQDHIRMGDNVESRWVIQNTFLHFLVIEGKLDLHFKYNENIHIRHLNYKKNLMILPGIPFMLKTYETNAKILLISITGAKDERHSC